MLGRTDSRGRLIFLLLLFVVGAIAIVGRLAWWQIVRYEDLSARATRQTSVRTEQPSPRGAIYDRSGLVVLATTIERDRVSVAADRLSVVQRNEIVAALTSILDLEEAARRLVAERLRTARPYVIIARDVPPDASDEIRAARLPHLTLEPEPLRVYPQPGGAPDSTLAAHLLGFVNREGVGQYGVEQYYQSLLAGSPRVLLAQRDVNARAIPETSIVDDEGVRGADLRLTIDAGLQLAVEQELLAAGVADRALTVSAVVMDPYTGEIFAHATYPSYDANDYRAIAAANPNRFVDPIISKVYEPGSVFKFFTAFAALEQGTMTPTTMIKDVGTLQLDNGKTKIDNADRTGRGWMRFEDAVAYSRNVVAAKVALALGKDTHESSAILHETWSRVGFGSPTGIDLAGEEGGLVRDPAITEWRQIDLANGAFGQGVAVTPIQLATAYAALMNGGTLIQPHVVKGIDDEEVAPTPRGTVTDAAMSETLVGMMGHVIDGVPFYQKRTQIPGYFVGGKTGTAQIWDAATGDWKNNMFNYSFVGWVARRPGAPELLVAVRINEAEPNVIKVGQLEMPVMSFELFRRIATDAIRTPGLLPDTPREPATPVASPGPVTADR